MTYLSYSVVKKHSAVAVAILVLAAGVVAGRERPSLELIEARAPAAQAADDGIDLDKLRRGEASVPQNDPFAQKNFASLEVKKVAQVQSKPTAPALPFQYFGRLTENGKTEVFVMRGDELISIAAGEKLGDYRVDKISESSIAFTYLPLKTKQTLDLQ